jgi:hypothetical protein
MTKKNGLAEALGMERDISQCVPSTEAPKPEKRKYTKKGQKHSPEKTEAKRQAEVKQEFTTFKIITSDGKSHYYYFPRPLTITKLIGLFHLKAIGGYYQISEGVAINVQNALYAEGVE